MIFCYLNNISQHFFLEQGWTNFLTGRAKMKKKSVVSWESHGIELFEMIKMTEKTDEMQIFHDLFTINIISSNLPGRIKKLNELYTVPGP